MTNEEAIANINMIRVAFVDPVTKEQRKLIDDTLDTAIKALEQQPCEDAISRQAVCNIVNDIRDCISVEGYCAIIERLKKLPPVTPKSETVTEFADRCRECGREKVLDKIRAEIDVARFIDKDTKLCKNANASGLEVAMQIIDKYR